MTFYSQSQKIAPQKNNDIRGNTAEVITGSRKPHQIQYRVVEAKDLNSSHVIDNGNVFANKNYPVELQPRDRSRVDMQAQLISMGNNLNPADLLDARDVNQGAPTTRSDGVVLNGNGRTAAIRYAYENGKGDVYKNALIQNAQRLGLNADEISKMNQPVLVRELKNDLSEEELKDIVTTQTGGARMGASEQAQSDATKLSTETLSLFPQDDNVDLTHASTNDFLRAALNDIATPDERNALTQSDGKINQDGINRVKRALFALAYGDNGLISRMSESTDDNVRGATNALLNAAPTIAKVQAAMENGTLHKYDLSAIADAVKKLSALRDEGKPVQKYLQEQSLFAEHADSAESKEILSFLDRHKRAPNKISTFLKKIVSNIQSQGDPRQGNLFGFSDEPKSLMDIIKKARQEVENSGQTTPLFSKQGNVDTRIENFVDDKDLTPQQKLLQSFGEKLGVKVKFFRNEDGDFHGAHSNGTSYINVNSKMPIGKVFWHESMHWLKANNPKLYQSLVNAAGITDEQRQAYLERTGRDDLETDAAIDEEILADQMEDVAKRNGLLQSIAGKNRGLIERVVQWLKDTMNKFIDHFRNPDGKLTTKQAIALADEFGRIAKDLVDPNGDRIFRYNRRTHNIELADGRDLDSVKTEHSEKRGAFKFNERPRIDFKIEHALNFSAQERIRAQENSGTTQVAGTKTMYVKALQYLRNLKNDIKTVLDYGAGLGLGTDAMRENNSDLKIDSYEPNPQRWQGKTSPTFTDNTKIKSQYDTILNTNVLNVVEPEIRNAIVRDIGSLLKVGGKAMITTRSWKGDIEKTKNYTLGDEPHSVWITRSVGGKPVRVYQKGFDGNELLDYVSDLLGEDFKVEKVNGFGKSGVVVTRIANSVDTTDEIKYSFAGRKAKTANLETLNRAKQMEKRGVNRDEIYDATGWFKGKDNKWRFEIPDNFDKIDFDKLLKNNENFFSLDKIYDNPALFAAYPQLRKVLVRSKQLKSPESYGYTNGTEITLNQSKINDEREEAGKTLVHEIQHVIQDYEKFSGGGSDSNVLSEMLRNLKLIRKEVATIPNSKKSFKPLSEAFSAVRYARDMGEYARDMGENETLQEAEEILQEAEDTIKIIKKGFSPTNWQKIKHLAERYSELSDTVDEIRDAKGEYETIYTEDGEIEEPRQPRLKYEAYERLGGEQEARAVGERLFNHNGTPKPHDEDALIIFGGNTYGMIKQSENKKKPIRNGDGELVKDGAMREIFPPSAATANGTTDYWSPASLKVTRDNKGGVGTSGNSVDTNSPNETIPQGEEKIKYSIGRSDNSSESLSQKIQNKFAAWWNGNPKKNRNKEITDLLYRTTGYKVDFGNVKDADQTIIDDVHKVIRAKHAYEWEKLLPQIGGKIAKTLKLNPTEEMNNYIADWCMTGAVGNRSAEAKAFEKAMHDDPVTAGLMLQIRDAFQEFNDMTADEKIGDTIVSRLKGKSPKEIAKTLWGEKEEQITDDLHPVLRQVNEMITKAEKTSPTLAKLMKEDINPYQLMRLLRGVGGLGDLMLHADAKNIEDVRNQFRALYPSRKFDRLVSLDMIIDMAGGKNHDKGLIDFAVAKLDKEMHEKLRANPNEDIRPQFSEAVDDEIIKAGEKQYSEAHRALVTYSNILACIQYDAGLLTDSQFRKLMKGWKNYIPMIRVFEEGEKYTFEDSLKHKTGSQRSTYNPLETLTQNTYDALSRAERNKAKQQFAFYARIGEFGDIIQEVETSNPGKNIIHYRENGEMKYLKVFDPAVKRAVDNIYTPADTSWIMKFLKATMSFVRSMYTQASFDFSIGNLFRDMQDAYIHNRHADANPFVAMLNVFREGFKGFGLSQMLKEKSLVPHDTDWVEFNALGGTQSTFVSEDIDQLRRSMNKLTRKTFKERFKENKLQTILESMQWLSEQTEYMTRLNSYKRAKAELAKQRPDGKATLVDKKLAALEARDASIDFAKAGTSTRKFNRLVMFANAQVQDWAKWGVIGRDYFKGGEAREIALQKIGRLMLTGVLATLLQAALNYSDDDRRDKYKRRPDWEKETYWIFADGLRIPKGQDIGTRFVSALTDEFIGKAMDDDPVSAKRILKVIKNATPSIIPSLIEPVYEVHMNYSSFRDAPIVPFGQQNLDKAEQYGKNTSSFAKLFGELTGWTSPRAVDYLISSYLGSTGKFVSRIPDFITRGATLDDVLMLRRFVFDPNENTKTVKDYYEAYNEQYKHYNTYKLQRKWDRNAKLPSDYDPKLYARLKSISEPLRKISAAENNILRNPKLDWDTKNKKLRELEKKREQLCEKIMRQAR